MEEKPKFNDTTLKVRVKADFKKENSSSKETEKYLSFQKGMEIEVLKINEETGWWFGKLENGKEGFFPSNFTDATEQQKKIKKKKVKFKFLIKFIPYCPF